jgi:hypothetical protein
VFKLIVVLLPLTLAWKLAVALKSNERVEERSIVIEFLIQNHFDVFIANEKIDESPVVAARSNECRLIIAKVSPRGDSSDQVQVLAAKFGHTFIVFRGATYSKQPVFLTMVNHLWFTSLWRLGVVSHVPIVLAVISSCDAQSLPWSALRFI